MNKVFLNMVNYSISAGYIVFVIFIVKKSFSRCPKWLITSLWVLVAIRLLFPVSIETDFSLMPSKETFELNLLENGDYYINTGFDIIDEPLNEYMGDKYFEGVTVRYNFKNDLTMFLAKVWVAGIVVMSAYAVYSYIKLKFLLRTATKYDENIYQSEFINTPFVLGIFSPKVYIPYHLTGRDIKYITDHELSHIKRKDHLTKIFAYGILCAYWFNPVMWLSYSMFCKDLELACDEKVIKTYDENDRRNYSEVLLSFGMDKKRFATCPLAFGEVGVKERIQSVMNYKKPTILIIGASALLIIFVAVFFMTNPMHFGIEDMDVWTENLFDDPEYIYVMNSLGSMEEYLLTEKESIDIAVEALRKIELNKHELSKSLADDRPRDRIIDIGGDVCLCFDMQCTQVWIDNSVKPSFTFRVKNPEYVLQTFFVGYLSDISFAEKFNGELITEFSDPANPSIRRFEMRNNLDEYIGIIVDTEKTVLEFEDEFIYAKVKERSGENLWDGVCPGGMYITLVPHTDPHTPPGAEMYGDYEWIEATEIYSAEKIIVGALDVNYYLTDGQ